MSNVCTSRGRRGIALNQSRLGRRMQVLFYRQGRPVPEQRVVTQASPVHAWPGLVGAQIEIRATTARCKMIVNKSMVTASV